jgi:hypothetical protein
MHSQWLPPAVKEMFEEQAGWKQALLNAVKPIIPPSNVRPVHFITYSDAVYEKPKALLLSQARAFRYPFKSVAGLGPGDVRQQVKQFDTVVLENGQQANMAHPGKVHGMAGIDRFKLWKVYLILSALDKAEDGEFVLYMDAGCTLNGSEQAVTVFRQIVEMLEESSHKRGYGTLGFQLVKNTYGNINLQEHVWTTDKIFSYFREKFPASADRLSYPFGDIAESQQLHSAIMLFKKNEHSLRVLQGVREALEHDASLASDDHSASSKAVNKAFMENRHDQSLFSVMRKIHGSVVVPHPCEFPNFWDGAALSFPFWATRCVAACCLLH